MFRTGILAASLFIASSAHAQIDEGTIVFVQSIDLNSDILIVDLTVDQMSAEHTPDLLVVDVPLWSADPWDLRQDVSGALDLLDDAGLNHVAVVFADLVGVAPEDHAHRATIIDEISAVLLDELGTERAYVLE